MNRPDRAGCDHCRSACQIGSESPRREHRESGDRWHGDSGSQTRVPFGWPPHESRLRAGRVARRKRLYEMRILLPRPSPEYSVELSGQRGVDHRELGTGIQKKVVGAGMVDGYRHDHLVAVCEMEGYTGDISGANAVLREVPGRWLRQERRKRPT